MGPVAIDDAQVEQARSDADGMIGGRADRGWDATSARW